MEQLIGVGLGGALAIIGGTVTAWLQARHQRKATRSKDLWDRRAELYLELLVHLDGTMSFADSPSTLGYHGPTTPEQITTRRELAAKVDLFGSRVVRTLWEAATEAAGDFFMEIVEGGYLGGHDGHTFLADNITEPRFLQLKHAKETTQSDLVQRLRHEIDVDEHLKP
ncbi:hypothetical protein [Streptomyces sp. NPDC002426]